MTFLPTSAGKLPGFIFGAGTDVPTYDALKRRREIADMMADRSMSSTPRTVGQGIAAVGDALASRFMDHRLKPQEKASGDRDGSRIMEIAGLLTGRGGSPVMSSMGGAPEAPGTTPTAPPGFTLPPQGDREQQIRDGLLRRGLPEHVADGFMLNFRDESRFDPGINEAAPVVPGSRGGFGLAQWTGPRRVALERFAQETGRPVGDVETQLDFLMTELQGSEAGAMPAIMGSRDAGGAAAAIASEFLRPAPEHLARRVADYTGGAGYQPGGLGSAGVSFDPALIAELGQLAGNPYLNDGQRLVAQALISRAMERPQQMTPYQQAQLSLDQQKFTWEQQQAGQTKPTDDMREYEFAVSQGYQGTLQDFMVEQRRAGAPNQTVKLPTSENEYDKERGKQFATSMGEFEAAEKTAGTALSTLKAAEAAMDQPGFYSGAGGQTVLQLKRAAKAFGADPAGVDSMEAFNAVASKAVLDAIGGSLGAQVSNADRDFIERQAINLGTTPEGNRAIITIQRKLAERQIAVAKMARAYEQKHGRFNNGFYDELAAWTEQNPLFDPADPIFNTTPGPAVPPPIDAGDDDLFKKYGIAP